MGYNGELSGGTFNHDYLSSNLGRLLLRQLLTLTLAHTLTVLHAKS